MHVAVADEAEPPRLVHELQDERRVVRAELAELQARRLVHDHGRAARRANSASSSTRPSGHGPCPESMLMCPALPMSVNDAPQPRANSAARTGVTYGSSWLATTCTGNGIGRRGGRGDGRGAGGRADAPRCG